MVSSHAFDLPLWTTSRNTLLGRVDFRSNSEAIVSEGEKQVTEVQIVATYEYITEVAAYLFNEKSGLNGLSFHVGHILLDLLASIALHRFRLAPNGPLRTSRNDGSDHLGYPNVHPIGTHVPSFTTSLDMSFSVH
jgi:hypothetical protein